MLRAGAGTCGSTSPNTSNNSALISESRASVPASGSAPRFPSCTPVGYAHNRCTTPRIQCCSKRKMSADTKSHGTERGTRGILLHIAADFEVIEHRTGGCVEMGYGRGVGQVIAVHTTWIVVGDYQAGRARSMVNLRCRHHKAMPGQAVCRSANRPRSAEISPSTKRCLDIWRPTARASAPPRRFDRKPVDGELNVRGGDLHGLSLPQTGS